MSVDGPCRARQPVGSVVKCSSSRAIELPSHYSPTMTYDHRNTWLAAVVYAGIFGLLIAALLARTQAEEIRLSDVDSRSGSVMIVGLVACAISLVLLATFWRQLVAGMGNDGLATIGLFVCVQFLVSYAARLADTVIGQIPLVAGIGNEALRLLVVGSMITLVPRPGTFAISQLAVFMLNSLFSGSFGVSSILFIALSVVLGEALLAAAGVTTFRRPARSRAWDYAMRLGLALGIANGLKLYLQFQLSQLVFRLDFATWFVLSIALVGMAYGMVGAACGALVGLRLRRTSP